MKNHRELKTEAAATLKTAGIKNTTIAKSGYTGITVTIHNREVTPGGIKALLAGLDTYTSEPYLGADYGAGQSVHVEYSKLVLDELALEILPVAAEIVRYLASTEGSPRPFTLPIVGVVVVSRANRYNPAHADLNGKTCGLGHSGNSAADIAWLLSRAIGSAF